MYSFNSHILLSHRSLSTFTFPPREIVLFSLSLSFIKDIVFSHFIISEKFFTFFLHTRSFFYFHFFSKRFCSIFIFSSERWHLETAGQLDLGKGTGTGVGKDWQVFSSRWFFIVAIVSCLSQSISNVFCCRIYRALQACSSLSWNLKNCQEAFSSCQFPTK